jgi:hypothetical protein
MEDTMTNADFEKMTIYRFLAPERAFSFADHAIKPMIVLLGDDQRYWVVRMSDADRLLRAGYEAAPRIF